MHHEARNLDIRPERAERRAGLLEMQRVWWEQLQHRTDTGHRSPDMHRKHILPDMWQKNGRHWSHG